MTELPGFDIVLSYHGEKYGSNKSIFRPRWRTTPKHRSLEKFDYENGGERPLPIVDLGWNQQAKINSFDNYGHFPGGGEVKIFNKPYKTDVKSKVDCKLEEALVELLSEIFKDRNGIKLPKITPHYGVNANVGSRLNCHLKISECENRYKATKYSNVYNNAKPKVDTTSNPYCRRFLTPAVPIFNDTLHWRGDPKVDTWENVDYVPGGGKVKITNRLPCWNIEGRMKTRDHVYNPPESIVTIPKFNIHWRSKAKVGSLKNIKHVPGGGNVKIINFNPRPKAHPKPRKLIGHEKNRHKKFKCDFPFLMA